MDIIKDVLIFVTRGPLLASLVTFFVFPLYSSLVEWWGCCEPSIFFSILGTMVVHEVGGGGGGGGGGGDGGVVW